MQKAELNIDGLSLSRTPSFGLKDITLKAKGGELILLKGPNGCGKTSLLRSLARVLSFHGSHSLKTTDTHWIASTPPFQANLTLKENLCYICALAGFTYNPKALKDFDVLEKENTLIQNLSAGQKQRAYLSLLLMDFRPVWLLDEPTNALDDTAKKMLHKFVEIHRRNGGISIIATHDTDMWTPTQTIGFDGEIE